MHTNEFVVQFANAKSDVFPFVTTFSNESENDTVNGEINQSVFYS